MSILQLEMVTNEQVVFKVKELSSLEIAMNPMFDGTMDYITVTRGRNHTLTVIKKDGRTYSFDWGENGFTLISDNMERLRKYVENEVKNNNIMLKHTSDNVLEGRAFYNSNFNAFQLTVLNDKGESQYLHFDTVAEREEFAKGLGLAKAFDEPNDNVGSVGVYKRA